MVMMSRLRVLCVLILGCLTCASLCGADPESARESKKLTSVEAGKLRARIRAALFVPDPLPALDPVTHGKFEPEPGVVAERVTYASQFGLRIPAILYLPKERKGKLPGLIVVNGHGGDKYSWYAFYSGILYARAGAAVLTFDPVGEGERNRDRKSGTRAHDAKLSPEEMGRRMGGLLLTDVMQAVSYLRERQDVVDPKRIGAMGYSLGSFLVAEAGAADDRLHACVAVGGGNLDGPDGYWDRSKPMCQGIPYQSLRFLGDRPAMIYALHALRGPTLVYNGLADSVVGIPGLKNDFWDDLQERTAQVLGKKEGIFEVSTIPDVSHRPFFVTKPVALWLRKQLDFPNWSEADVQGMKETRIGNWARANDVTLDPLYSTEQREGGTPALGVDVPGLTRKQLSVFSPEEWEKNKDRLIYESWVKEARSRLEGARR
jgi:dienelactone hydrolase